MKSEIETIISFIAGQINNDNMNEIFEYKFPAELDKGEIEELCNEIDRICNMHEITPLRIISILIIIYYYQKHKIQQKYLYILIKGLNYYGYYSSIEYIMRNLTSVLYFINENESIYYILLLLQYAKFQKNNGEINNALSTYEKIFNTINKNNHILTIYVLTSYANFCNDYLLREGKYRTFCTIAYKRLCNIDTNSLTLQEKRWKQIIQDTYAKSIFTKDCHKANSIYAQICDEIINTEIYLRVKLRWIELKIIHTLTIINNGKDEFDFIFSLIEEYLSKYQILLSINNPKAIYIRKLKFYELIRLIEESRIDFSKKHNEVKRDSYLNNIFLDISDCIDDMDDISQNALRFNDRKSYARARYEMGIWSEKWGIKNNTIRYLESAKKIIFCNSIPISASLYLNITQKLAESYSNNNDYKKAIECYQDLYVFIDKIMNHLINDKKDLDNKKDEYSFLQEEELSLINNCIISDYQFLATNISSIYKQILMTQIKSGVITTHNYLDSIIHDTNNDLNMIDFLLSKHISDIGISTNKNPVQSDKNKLNKHINNIKERLISFRKNIEVDEISYFDIGSYSEMILKSFVNDFPIISKLILNSMILLN